MPQNFTPTKPFEGSEKEWPGKLAALDWDKTKIVFTKRQLVEFLRYTGTSVDPNWSNVQKLPRFAEFGEISGEVEEAAAVLEDTHIAEEEKFIPTRKVRTAPGGNQTFNIYDQDEEEPVAPPKPKAPVPASKPIQAPYQTEEPPNVIPSRKVRAAPGGNSSLGGLFSEEPPVNDFIPTRKVRTRPGGDDHISDIFLYPS